MRCFVAFACLIGLAGIAASVRANPPTVANSTLPAGIQMVGATAGVPDPLGEAVVTFRDDGNNPVPNATVELMFGACYTAPEQDLWISASQPFPGLTVSCNAGATTMSVQTDTLGRAVFRILGSSRSTPAGLTTACVTVRANGIVLGTLRLGAYDLDGENGVNASDLGLLLKVLFSSPAGYRTRSDYNGDGLCNSADLGKMLSAVFRAGSLASAPRCLD